MLLNWYAIQKNVEARQVEVARMAEGIRLLKEARQGAMQGSRLAARPSARRVLRAALSRLVPAAGAVLARGTESARAESAQ